MNATHAPRMAGPFLAALFLALLAGCATTGTGGGGLVPVRGDRPAATGTSRTGAAAQPVNPAANDPAAMGADDVPVPGATPVPEPGEVVGKTASGGTITRRTPAVVDSGPSDDARRVLATIPDPVPAGQQVAPPASVQQRYPVHDATPGTGTAADSAGTAEGDSAAAGVPIPERTLPLGQGGTQSIPTIPDSVLRALADSGKAAPSPGAPAAATPPAGTTAAGTPPAAAPGATAPDSCWRVQIAAPEEPERAEQLRRAAESLLLVPMVVEKEGGLHKVRTRDCLSADSAGNLKSRADASGFDGAFRFLRKR